MEFTDMQGLDLEWCYQDYLDKKVLMICLPCSMGARAAEELLPVIGTANITHCNSIYLVYGEREGSTGW